MGLIEEGLVDAVAGGPPCATWSRARFVPLPGGGGPRPLRHRGPRAWGLPPQSLTSFEKERLDEGNLTMLNFLSFCEAAALRGGLWLLEHPEDPGEGPFPSIWAMDLERALEERTGATRAVFDQCTFGGPTR